MISFLFRFTWATLMLTLRVAWVGVKLIAGLLVLAADGEMKSDSMTLDAEDYWHRHPFDPKGYWARQRGE